LKKHAVGCSWILAPVQLVLGLDVLSNRELTLAWPISV
jgi:hypothetical protein